MPRKLYTIAINPPNPDNWGRVCVSVFLHGVYGGALEFTPGFSREQIRQVASALATSFQNDGASACVIDYWNDESLEAIGPDHPRHLQAVGWAKVHKTEPHERNE